MPQILFNNQDISVEDKIILKKVDLSINSGDFILLSGVSGSGKTTFINEIVKKYPKTTARVFQDSDQQFTMATPFLELIFLLENNRLPSDQIENKINNILSDFNLLNKKNQSVETLSGGEQQRLALAEAVNLDSNLIILDEPFANVDMTNTRFLLTKIQRLQQQGKTIIIADHDPLLYRDMADRIFLFENQAIRLLSKEKFSEFYQRFAYESHFQLVQGSMPLRILLQKLSIHFPDQILLEKTQAQIYESQNVLINGENGSGKSTLLKAIAGLEKYQGQIKKTGKLSLAFQNASDSFLKITVKEEIELSKRKKFHHSLTDDQITDWLQKLSLDQLLNSSVYTLSGGERKKLQILLLGIQAPDIMLLDEPFTGLDKNSVLNLIDFLNSTRSTKIFTSHQLFALDKIINAAYLIHNYHLTQLETLP